jgi:ornithine carbamoyltransferase
MLDQRNFLSILDFSPLETEHLVKRASELKVDQFSNVLKTKNIVLLFEKPSLRTKVSFDIGIKQLGGHSIYMGAAEVGFGKRESTADIAKVLSRYAQSIVARVNNHSSLVELAKHSGIPIINALSDWEHPCQTMADLQTIKETKQTLKGLTVAFIGDGNNVARSLALGIAATGSNFAIASPMNHDLDNCTLNRARAIASSHGTSISTVRDPQEAVQQADVVYTDVWTSMGKELESSERRFAFKGYTVSPELMNHAKPEAIFMHDMPAHYGEEVTLGMLDHPSSVVFDQAENRLHSQKAILEFLLTRTSVK